MDHELILTIRIVDNEVLIIFEEPESGLVTTQHYPISVDEHPEFDKSVGDEIYSWISLWLDEQQ